MANQISLEDFNMSARKLTEDMAVISAKFIDEFGRSLKERERQTTFYDGQCLVRYIDVVQKRVRFGDPEHSEIWQKHEAALVQETAHLVYAMKGASFSAWCAAMRIIGVRFGIKLPLRPGDSDPDEHNEV